MVARLGFGSNCASVHVNHHAEGATGNGGRAGQRCGYDRYRGCGFSPERWIVRGLRGVSSRSESLVSRSVITDFYGRNQGEKLRARALNDFDLHGTIF
jgi:hypothetical protein